MSVYFAQAYPGQSTPPTIHWGVDSLRRASEGPPQGSNFIGGYTTLYDAVVSQNGAGKKPEFWGRYIGPIGLTQLTQVEADFLHARNVKILLIYNNTYTRDAQGNYHVSTYADGVYHANAAIDYITTRNLQLPPRVSGKRVWIYLNTETGDDPNTGQPYPTLPKELYQGWCDRLSDASVPYGLVGGVYGSTAVADASTFSQPYCNAWAQDPLMRAEITRSLLYSPRPMRCFGSLLRSLRPSGPSWTIFAYLSAMHPADSTRRHLSVRRQAHNCGRTGSSRFRLSQRCGIRKYVGALTSMGSVSGF